MIRLPSSRASISVAILALAVSGAVVVYALRAMPSGSRPAMAPLPVLGTAAFSGLTDFRGERFDADALTGHVWIANFIFTSCPSQCLLMTDRLRGLQRDFLDDAALRFVSFSVDPEHDTPAVLAEYAARHGADARWVLATGEHAAVSRICQEVFRLSVGESTPGQPITHSVKFVLVDRAGRIRGYYDVTEVRELVRLRSDARALLEERG